MSEAKASKKRGGRRTPAGGRPAKRPEERAAYRVTVRLSERDASLLELLCRVTSKSESELMRHAIRVLALAYELEPARR